MTFSRCTQRLTFIGSGNMATAILGGLIDRQYPSERIQVCGPDTAQLEALNSQYRVLTSTHPDEFMQQTDILFLCVKPQVMESVCRDLGPLLSSRGTTVVSIAAGTSTRQIVDWLGRPAPVIRCMPNTPAMVHEGASGLYALPDVGEEPRSTVASLFEAIGSVCWVEDEKDLHAVTALSGSGPAYGFLFLEAMEAAGIEMGLSPEVAHQLATQTLKGAALLAQQSQEPPATLKQRVMSPGGTTEQAIWSMEGAGVTGLIRTAILKAWQRSYTLAGENPPAGVSPSPKQRS